jgi:uncharacterized membrane protein
VTGEPDAFDNADMDARDRRHGYDRMNQLSDGVFAIAITLLAFDIRPPASWNGSIPQLLAALQPLLAAYATSFAVIATYWFLHRRYVAMMTRLDGIATALNLLFLALVALLPADTRLANLGEGRLDVLEVYSVLVVALGVALSLLWGYAVFVGQLVPTVVTARLRWTMFIAPSVLPPLLLFIIIGLHVPQGAVPAAIIILFGGGYALMHRLGQRRRAQDTPAPKNSPAAPS